MGDVVFARVTESERPRAVEVLVSAFTDDPFVRWLYPDDEGYLRDFPGAIFAFGGLAFEADTVWRIGDFDGVALWYPPGLLPDDAIVGYLQETVPADRVDDMLGTFEQVDHAHPTYPNWYLPWFGVHASRQGRGIGGELMRRCLDVVDADHLPGYLESPNPRNLPFYERHGFVRTGESQQGTAPPLISMLREAR